MKASLEAMTGVSERKMWLEPGKVKVKIQGSIPYRIFGAWC